MQEVYNMKYHIYWSYITREVFIRDSVKVKDLDDIRYLLLSNGYIYKNIIIGYPEL